MRGLLQTDEPIKRSTTPSKDLKELGTRYLPVVRRPTSKEGGSRDDDAPAEVIGGMIAVAVATADLAGEEVPTPKGAALRKGKPEVKN